MSDAPALLAAIRAAPDDDAPRLVYADWLDEHGDPARAEFIRVQCELARHDSPALRRREAELLAAHHDKFAGPLAAPPLRFRFHRGFVVGFGHIGVFRTTIKGSGEVCVFDLLRFYPDGIVTSSRTLDLQVDPLGHDLGPDRHRLRRRNADHSASYSLDPFDYPAGLQFTFTSANGAVEYRGVLEGASASLELYNPQVGILVSQRYTHVPLDGFDSFTET